MPSDPSADFQALLSQINLDSLVGQETPAADLLAMKLRSSNGRVFSPVKLRGALKAGQAAGYGTYTIGRRGYATRFAWAKPPEAAAPAAAAPAAEAPAPAPAPEAPAPAPAPAAASAVDGPEGIQTVRHSLRLRADVTLHVELPVDLTDREAERLAHWVQALPVG